MPRFKSTKPIDSLFHSAITAKIYDDAAALPCGTAESERMMKKWIQGMARHFRQRFAQKLRAMREQAGLSRQALADKAGVDHSHLVRLESAEESCTLETAVNIAAALGMSLGLLADEAA